MIDLTKKEAFFRVKKRAMIIGGGPSQKNVPNYSLTKDLDVFTINFAADKYDSQYIAIDGGKEIVKHLYYPDRCFVWFSAHKQPVITYPKGCFVYRTKQEENYTLEYPLKTKCIITGGLTVYLCCLLGYEQIDVYGLDYKPEDERIEYADVHPVHKSKYNRAGQKPSFDQQYDLLKRLKQRYNIINHTISDW